MDNQIIIKLFITSSSSKKKRWLAQAVLRALKNKTISDRHPLPRVQVAIDSLNGKKWCSLLDQQKAYHQICRDPESHPLTAFITLGGLYEWVIVPFGLSNAPIEFQRYMENCLTDVRDTLSVLIFAWIYFRESKKIAFLRVLIFVNGRFQKSSRVLIFANPLELSFGYGQLFKFKIKFEISR